MKSCLLLFLLFSSVSSASSQWESFCSAFISDTRTGSPNGGAEATARKSAGISADDRYKYGKTRNDTMAGFPNSMVNTVNLISTRQVVTATIDGKVFLLEIN